MQGASRAGSHQCPPDCWDPPPQKICNAVVKDGKIPEDWSRSWMVNVYKGKGWHVAHIGSLQSFEGSECG